MTRKLASIEVIENLEPIPKADKILKATVKGWECVVSVNDNLNVGDKVIYVEVDSVLPQRPEFEFMRPRNFRVRTIKLRGQVSQGLVLPLKLVGGVGEVGDDVTEKLGIEKYDLQAKIEKKLNNASKPKNPIVSWMFRFKWFRDLWRKFEKPNEPFPTSIVSKTDEERIQNLPNEFKEWFSRNIPFFVTEKIDGQSATYFLKDGEFGVCSRNIWLRKEDDSSYWTIAREQKLKDVLKTLQKEFKAEKVVIQGEIIGSGIQGNKYKLNGYDFYVFNVIIDGIRLDQSKMDKFCRKCHLKTVPTIYICYRLPKSIAELVEVSKGKSLMTYGLNREGLVFRNYNERISFKVINPNFLLKEKD